MKNAQQLSALLMLFATLVLSSTAKAAPAYPKKIEMTEPATGLRVSGYQVGDEFFSYCTDEQGRLFELDTDGRFRRVVRDGSGYALGGYVTQVSVRSSVAEGADVSRGDAGLREKLTNMRETLHADVPMLLDDGEEEEQPVRLIWGYDHVLEERDAAAGRWRAYAASDSAHYNILKIPSNEPGVYVLVENRQFTGFDEGLDWAYRYCMNPLRGGLVIWRIDENIINQYWQMNWVNCNPDGRGITVFFTQDDPDVIDEYKELELTPFYKSGMEPLYLEMDTDLAVAFSGEGRLMRPAVTGLGAAPDVLPKTGDRSHLLLWALLLAISVAALAALGWLIRKKVIRSLSM